jgi:hypothetical protein
MVREGPNEPPAQDPADTPEGRQASLYGMRFTAAAILLAILVVAWFLIS